jgi:hypothetical protein
MTDHSLDAYYAEIRAVEDGWFVEVRRRANPRHVLVER